MIFNNFRAIERIREWKDKPLSRELVFVQDSATGEVFHDRAFSDINYRQQALISHALLHLNKLGLLDMRKARKAFAFRAPRDLEQKLRSLNDDFFS